MLNSTENKLCHVLNAKIQPVVTIDDMLTFIRMINTTSESLKAGKVVNFQHFSFSEQMPFHG